MDRIKEIRKFYDEASFRKLHGYIYTNPRVEYAWSSLNTLLSYINPQNILEIGSGIGEISYRLARKLPATQIVGFDISEVSIQLAHQLFVLPNLRFVREDNIKDIKKITQKKFDVILLMDVYEHISTDFREELNEFIKSNVAENGVLFLSCPTPQHLTYLKKNDPSEIQPVDEDISFKELIEISTKTSLRLNYYKEVSVWRAGDYFHAVFSNYLKMQPFSDFKVESPARKIGLKEEIFNKIKKLTLSKASNLKNQDEILKKKELIRARLGQEILTKVEAFKK